VVVSRGSQGDQLLPAEVKEVYDPGDADSLARAILRLRDRPDREAVARRARALAEARSWDRLAARVVERIETLG